VTIGVAEKSYDSKIAQFVRNQNFKQTSIILSRRNGDHKKNMKIIILTIYYALGAALLASIHEISAYDHAEESDDFQIDADQEVDVAVSCYLLVDTTISLVYSPFLHRMLTSFRFRYDL
jgi:hypothetical protein